MADEVEGLTSSLVQIAVSFVVSALFLSMTEDLPFSVPMESWGWIIILGVVNTGLGCYLYFSSFEGLSAQTVAVLGYLEPLSAVVCAMVFLGEPMEMWEVVGGALIIGGALLGTAQKGTKAAQDEHD